MASNPLDQLIPSLRKPKLATAEQGFGANTPATLYDYQGQLADEAHQNLLQATKAGAAPNVLQGLMGQMQKWQMDRTKSDIPRQQAEYEQFGADNRSAILEGFGGGPSFPNQQPTGGIDDISGAPMFEEQTPNVSPLVARNLYKRKQEQEKMRMPLRQEQVRAAGGIQQQQIQSQGLRDVAETTGKYDVEQERIRQAPQSEFYALQKMLLDRQSQGGAQIDSLGKNTINLVNQPNQTSMLNQGTVVRQNLARRGGQLWLNPNIDIPEQAAYNAYVGNLVGTANIAPDAKRMIIESMSNPQTARQPIEQLFDISALTKEEYAALVDLFIKARGF